MGQNRSYDFIATFESGYAAGWVYAVGECFKDQLDIKYVARKENNKTVMRWTQGSCYAFKEGHTLYDSPKAYLVWSDALKYFHLSCQVEQASPNIFQEKEKVMIAGWVKFSLYKPNVKKTGIEKIGTYSLSQNGFVQYLKSGKM